MKVVVNGDALSPPLTGLGYYTAQLVEQFCLILGDEMVDILYLGHIYPATRFLAKLREGDDAPARAPQFVGLLRRLLSRMPPAVWLYHRYLLLRGARLLRAYTVDDVLFCPNYVAVPFPGRTIVTIADLSTVRFPHWHPRARVSFVNRAINEAICNADAILTLSRFVADEIAELYPVADAKLQVTYPGVDSIFRPRDESEIKEFLEDRTLDFNGYFISFATFEPRKNFASVLDAYERYADELSEGDPFPLVITGSDGWHSQKLAQRLRNLAERFPIHTLGYVCRADLARLVAGARATFYLSIYEGFGLPVLEAMRSKTVAVTSAGTSMEEFAKDCAVIVPPRDINRVAEAMACLASDAAAMSGLLGVALERAQTLTWRACAEETLAALRTIER